MAFNLVQLADQCRLKAVYIDTIGLGEKPVGSQPRKTGRDGCDAVASGRIARPPVIVDAASAFDLEQLALTHSRKVLSTQPDCRPVRRAGTRIDSRGAAGGSKGNGSR